MFVVVSAPLPFSSTYFSRSVSRCLFLRSIANSSDVVSLFWPKVSPTLSQISLLFVFFIPLLRIPLCSSLVNMLSPSLPLRLSSTEHVSLCGNKRIFLSLSLSL